MPPERNYRKFVRNVTVVGGTAAAVDLFSRDVGPYELLLQFFLTLVAGLYGLFGRSDDGDNDSGLPA